MQPGNCKFEVVAPGVTHVNECACVPCIRNVTWDLAVGWNVKSNNDFNKMMLHRHFGALWCTLVAGRGLCDCRPTTTQKPGSEEMRGLQYEYSGHGLGYDATSSDASPLGRHMNRLHHTLVLNDGVCECASLIRCFIRWVYTVA